MQPESIHNSKEKPFDEEESKLVEAMESLKCEDEEDPMLEEEKLDVVGNE